MFRPLTPSPRALVSALLLLLLVLGMAAPSGAGLLGDFTVKDEQEAGEQFKQYIKTHKTVINDPEIRDFVRNMVARLQKELPPIPFHIEANVLLDSTLNAFAGPGGAVYVNSGLILSSPTEAALAGVLAHELGHVVQRHIAGRIGQQQKLSLLTMAAMLAGLATRDSDTSSALTFGGAAAAQSAMLAYSRRDEDEADQVGFNCMVQAGYDAHGLIDGFTVMLKHRNLTGSSIPQYLSTHPDMEARIAALQARLARMAESVPASAEATGSPAPADAKAFRRVQTLLRARYADVNQSLAWFRASAPDTCDASLGEALVLTRLNNQIEARAAFDKALSCSPEDPIFHREYGAFLFRFGDMDDAEKHLVRAMLRLPNDPMAHYYFARLLDQKEQYSQAQEHYVKTLTAVPEDAEVRYHYGRSLGVSGQLFDAYLQLAQSSMYDNKPKLFEQHMAKARELAGDDPARKTAIKDVEKRRREWEGKKPEDKEQPDKPGKTG